MFASRISSGGYTSIPLCVVLGLHDSEHVQRGFRAWVSLRVSDPFLPFLNREAKAAQTVSENFYSGTENLLFIDSP